MTHLVMIKRCKKNVKKGGNSSSLSESEEDASVEGAAQPFVYSIVTIGYTNLLPLIVKRIMKSF